MDHGFEALVGFVGAHGDAFEFLELRLLNANLAFVEGNLRRLFTDTAAIDHILDGLRKAGFE
jgi:hypothetical protein